jgi:hypothetical protein
MVNDTRSASVPTDQSPGQSSGGNDGLVRFKEKWGAHSVDLYRYHYPRHREVERTILAPRHLRGAAQSAWRQVPLPATAALGKFVYGRL